MGYVGSGLLVWGWKCLGNECVFFWCIGVMLFVVFEFFVWRLGRFC